jgi:PAS domain S-box-containing protein
VSSPDVSEPDLLQYAPYMMTRQTADGIFRYVSPASEVLTGYAPHELIGRSSYDVIHPDEQPKLRRVFTTLPGKQPEQTAAYRLRQKNGEYIWVKTSYKFVPDGEVLGFSEDFNQEKILENALQVLAQHNTMLDTDDWFRVLISHLTTVLRVNFAFITELTTDGQNVRMLAFWKGTGFGDPYAYPLIATPCDKVINEGQVCYHPLGVQAIFPKDADMVALDAQGYLGVPIFSLDRAVIGHIAILDNKPLKLTDAQIWLARLFANRAGIELERRQRQKLSAGHLD